MAKIFFRKYAIHLILWAIALIYMMGAPKLYNRLFLSEGMPVSLDREIPAETDDIRYEISNLSPKTVSGEDIYVIKGWAFLSSEKDQSQYRRFLMLKSTSRTYFFPIVSTKTPDLAIRFKDLDIDMSNSGISARISKEFIKRGKYQIGLIFAHKTNNPVFYTTTNLSITRTPNNIQIDLP